MIINWVFFGERTRFQAVMVGYTPDEKPLSHTQHVAAGAGSGVVTRMLTQPLDVLKIRFQVVCFTTSGNSMALMFTWKMHFSLISFRLSR